MSLEIGRQSWPLNGNSSKDSGIEVKDCPERGGILLCGMEGVDRVGGGDVRPFEECGRVEGWSGG